MVPTECWVQASPQTVPVKADLGAGVTVDHLRGLGVEESHGSQGSPQPLGHVLLPAHVLALSLALPGARSTGVNACAVPAQGWAGSGLWMKALLGDRSQGGHSGQVWFDLHGDGCTQGLEG